MEYKKGKSGEYYLYGCFTFRDHDTFFDMFGNIKRTKNIKDKTIILDFNNVDFIDSAALGMLSIAHEQIEKKKSKIVLRNANGEVLKVLYNAGFYTLFDIINDENIRQSVEEINYEFKHKCDNVCEENVNVCEENVNTIPEEIDRNKECLEKIVEVLQSIKPRKAYVQTYEEYNYQYKNRQYLQIENIIKLLCEKNIITREELEDRMKKDYEENILPNLQQQVDDYNKIYGFDKE